MSDLSNSMVGNQNALRYNKCVAMHVIKSVESYVIGNPHKYHLGGALVECGYYPELWSRLHKRYRNDNTVCQAIKRVEVYLESKIVNASLSGEARSAAMAIFVLKNKYGYVDKTESEITSGPGKVTKVEWVFEDEAETQTDT